MAVPLLAKTSKNPDKSNIEFLTGKVEAVDAVASHNVVTNTATKLGMFGQTRICSSTAYLTVLLYLLTIYQASTTAPNYQKATFYAQFRAHIIL